MKAQYWRLPPRLRKILKKPLGEVKKNIGEYDSKEIIICVGDQASTKAIETGLHPKVIVYDAHTHRRYVGISPQIKKYEGKEMEISNPRGSLNTMIFPLLKEALKLKENVKIKVDGEEDLITLASIYIAPFNSYVLYGQPGEGIVEVRVTQNIKNKVKDMLEDMRKYGTEY